MTTKIVPKGESPPKDYDEKVNLITPAGYEILIGEARHLADIERPKIVDEVHHAALQGDRSENAEYIYGKRRLREIDKRLGFLKRRLDAAKIINPSLQKSEMVLFGATVTIEDEANQSKSWTIVGEDEADPTKGRISWKSPVGRALLFKKPGDLVTSRTPAGEREFTIITIEYI